MNQMKLKKKTKTAWLTLSKADTEFDRILVLGDIFKQFNPATNEYDKLDATFFWTTLINNGISIHPLIEQQYIEQGICLYCGGDIDKVEGITPDRWEKRCRKCAYLFEEN